MNYIDLHQDLWLHIHKRDLFKTWQTSFQQNNSAHAKIIVATAFPVPENNDHFSSGIPSLIEQDLVSYNEYVSNHEQWRIIKNNSDIDECCVSDNESGILLHIEGLNVFNATVDDWQQLHYWHDQLGLRSIGLVWNRTNKLGGGTEDSTTGLSQSGAEVIQWCEENSIVVDCAHMNEVTFWDVVSVSQRPLLVSHANARAIQPTQRNLHDNQLRQIADSGGVVGVFFAPMFINGTDTATLDDLYKHIKHIYDCVGSEHIAIGSDFGGLITGLMKDISSVEAISKLWKYLSLHNFSESVIKKIAYKNAQRVLQSHLASCNG